MSKNQSLFPVLVAVVVAFALWYFAFQTEIWNFWLIISLSATLLAGGALWHTSDRAALWRFDFNALLIGILSAALLYGVFWAGKYIATALLPFAADQISSVYARQEQLNPFSIALLLFFILGPAEEIFWRAFIQRRLCERCGDRAGWLTATAVYAAVHLWTLNFMLVAAAAVVGLFWGWLYLRTQSLIAVMLSHALWDVAIFVLLPLI